MICGGFYLTFKENSVILESMRLNFLLSTIGVFFLSTNAQAEKAAQLKIFSLSAELAPHTHPFGGNIYFTTYDGLSSHPRIDDGKVSHELSPSLINPSLYQTDFLYYFNGVLDEHGTLSFSMPTEDSNKNGVYDWLEVGFSVNTSVEGSLSIHWPTSNAGTVAITAEIIRSSGNAVGSVSYSYQINDPINGITTVSSSTNWVITNWVGELVFDDSGNGVFNASASAAGATIALSGEGQFSSDSEGNLILEQGKAMVSDDIITFHSTELERINNTFRGGFLLEDGDPDTFWKDEHRLYLEITDTNDYDSDGMPDLVDPEPIKNDSVSFAPSGWGFIAWPWVYSHTDQGWLYFSAVNNQNAVWRENDQKWYIFESSSSSWEELE